MVDDLVERFDILIVGGGHAGAQCAIMLRQRGYAGSVAIVGEEPEPPYERPPLSKDYLSGGRDFAQLMLRPLSFWREREVALLGGLRIVAVDPAGKSVTCSDGRRIGYGTLVWAAGGAARRLTCDGGDLAGVHTIRTRADVDQLIAELPGRRRAAIVGGGYIGLEAAATLRSLGLEVTVLEAQDRLLARVAGPAIADFFAREHRHRGVDVRFGVTVVGIEGLDGRASGVRLANGDVVPADLVIVGVGIVPEVGPLAQAGARIGNGVEVDSACRTSLDGVFAIGDCAARPSRHADGRLVRLESVQNANDMANAAAQAITGGTLPEEAVPWFWSNQFDLRLQTVGFSAGFDAEIVRGDPAARSFSVVYLKAGRVAALDCVNVPRDYVQGRALVDAGARIDPALLADAGRTLKEIGAA